jgi:homoprotocatechuate degradation regulator HpaR
MTRSNDTLFKHRNLPLLLLQAREGVISRFRPLLNAHGVTEQQWRIVRALVECGPMEPRQIVQVCGISSPSLAGVLARMDEMSFVQRERFDNDARRVLVKLTPKSRALARRLAPKIEAEYADLETLIGPEFIQALYVSLEALVARLGAGSTEETT